MTGVRRAKCDCCLPTGVDACKASMVTGCTTASSSCPSTYAVTLSLNSFTIKRNCGTESEPSCQDYLVYPALSKTVTVTQNAINKCIYEGSLDISSGADTFTTNPCSGSSTTYSWKTITAQVKNSGVNLVTGAQLAPCNDGSYCASCAGMCIGFQVEINNDTSGGTFDKLFSACYFSHCLTGTCSDSSNLTPCYNYYSTADATRTEYAECTSANNTFDNECIADGYGWSSDCATNVVGRASANWGFTVTIS